MPVPLPPPTSSSRATAPQENRDLFACHHRLAMKPNQRFELVVLPGRRIGAEKRVHLTI